MGACRVPLVLRVPLWMNYFVARRGESAEGRSAAAAAAAAAAGGLWVRIGFGLAMTMC